MKILSLIDYKNIIQRGSFDLIHISLSVGEFNNELVLIKKYPKYSSIHNWKNELLYLNSYEHDNILTFLGFSVIPQEHDLLCLILEYTPLGSLQMVLNRISDIPIPLMLSWNKDILHAMKFIHSKGFNYVDIQLEHIFLFPNMKVKLSSFNQNTEIHSCIEEISKEFYFCLPPEIVNREGYLINSNIYSFAMLMCYLFLDKPFGFSSLLKDNTVSVIVTKTLQWLLDNYLNKKAIPSSFDNFQKNLYNCVDSNPENRPSSIDFYQCMEKFLSDLNYNNRDHAHLFHELASKQTEIHQNQVRAILCVKLLIY